MDTASTHATTSTLSFQPPVKTLDFRFHGKGFEYFRIWIVNILLSVLTLGIYSAWAKVRNKQYFYGNTELDGASFTYDAQPIKILKGRMIALGFIALLSFISTVNPLLGILIPLAFIPMTPFFIQRSLLFNARYSSYRNVRFGFTGSFKDAMMVFAGWPLIIAASLFIISLVFGAAGIPPDVMGIIAVLAYVIVLIPLMFYLLKQFVISNSMYGASSFKLNATALDFYKVFLKSFGFGLVTIVLFLTALAGVGSALSYNSEDFLQGFSDFSQMISVGVPSMIVGVLAYFVVLVLCYAFFMSQMNNLVFNNTKIDDFEFRSSFTTRSYAQLHVVNLFMTLLTWGLFWPFAKVRIARYKAAHTQVLARSSLDQFVARQEQEVGALGEAIGDFYDLDFGI